MVDVGRHTAGEGGVYLAAGLVDNDGKVAREHVDREVEYDVERLDVGGCPEHALCAEVQALPLRSHVCKPSKLWVNVQQTNQGAVSGQGMHEARAPAR